MKHLIIREDHLHILLHKYASSSQMAILGLIGMFNAAVGVICRGIAFSQFGGWLWLAITIVSGVCGCICWYWFYRGIRDARAWERIMFREARELIAHEELVLH